MPIREAVRLTDASIRDLAKPNGKRRRVWDAAMPGLVLRVMESGRASWYLRQRVGRRVVERRLGPWPTLTVDAARQRVREVMAQPAAAVAVTVTLKEAMQRYTALMKARGRAEDSILKVRLSCELAMKAGVDTLTDPDLARKLERWLHRMTCSPITRHRHRVNVCTVIRAAMRHWPEAFAKDPLLALDAFTAPLPAPAFFSPDEARILASDAALKSPFGRLVAFLLYTGCRLREGVFARWDRIDWEGRTYAVIPPTASERKAGYAVKRNKARAVPLADELMDLLTEWKAGAASSGGWIFDADLQRKCGSGYMTLAFRQHVASLGIPVADGEGRNRRMHSLRHTHAILVTAAGMDSLRLRLALGHAGEAMAAHYASAALRFTQRCRRWAGQLRLRGPAPEAAPAAPAAAPVVLEAAPWLLLPTATLTVPWMAPWPGGGAGGAA